MCRVSLYALVLIFGVALSLEGAPLSELGEREEVERTAKHKQLGITWVKISGGSFKMGSDDGDADERPAHLVQVRSFMMSKTEVTVGQYRKCVEAGRCTPAARCGWGSSSWSPTPDGREDHPISCVDWGQARTFARWVGDDVDLPTEAEWEYAARGGQDDRYAGSNLPDEVAWYGLNSGGEAHPVGTKKANGYGLHDMSGNIYEWVLDEWSGSYQGASSDGSKPKGEVPACLKRCEQGSVRRVIRGGSWNNNADNIRVSGRFSFSPDFRNHYLGFRVRKATR